MADTGLSVGRIYFTLLFNFYFLLWNNNWFILMKT